MSLGSYIEHWKAGLAEVWRHEMAEDGSIELTFNDDIDERLANLTEAVGGPKNMSPIIDALWEAPSAIRGREFAKQEVAREKAIRGLLGSLKPLRARAGKTLGEPVEDKRDIIAKFKNPLDFEGDRVVKCLELALQSLENRVNGSLRTHDGDRAVRNLNKSSDVENEAARAAAQGIDRVLNLQQGDIELDRAAYHLAIAIGGGVPRKSPSQHLQSMLARNTRAGRSS